jgi:hypothetical protein
LALSILKKNNTENKLKISQFDHIVIIKALEQEKQNTLKTHKQLIINKILTLAS